MESKFSFKNMSKEDVINKLQEPKTGAAVVGVIGLTATAIYASTLTTFTVAPASVAAAAGVKATAVGTTGMVVTKTTAAALSTKLIVGAIGVAITAAAVYGTYKYLSEKHQDQD